MKKLVIKIDFGRKQITIMGTTGPLLTTSSGLPIIRLLQDHGDRGETKAEPQKWNPANKLISNEEMEWAQKRRKRIIPGKSESSLGGASGQGNIKLVNPS